MSYVDSRPATATVTVNVAVAEDAAATDGSAGGSAHDTHQETFFSFPSSSSLSLPRSRTSETGARGRVGPRDASITPPVQPGIWSGRVAIASSSHRSSFRSSSDESSSDESSSDESSFSVVAASDGGTFISQHCPRAPAAAHALASSPSPSSPSSSPSPQCAHALQPRVLEHSRQHPDADSANISDPSRSIAPAGKDPKAAAQKPSSGSSNVRFSSTGASSSSRVGDASSAAGVAVAVAAADHASSSSASASAVTSSSSFSSSFSFSPLLWTATLNA